MSKFVTRRAKITAFVGVEGCPALRLEAGAEITVPADVAAANPDWFEDAPSSEQPEPPERPEAPEQPDASQQAEAGPSVAESSTAPSRPRRGGRARG